MNLKDKEFTYLEGTDYEHSVVFSKDVEEAVLSDKSEYHHLIVRLQQKNLINPELHEELEKYYLNKKEIFGEWKK